MSLKRARFIDSSGTACFMSQFPCEGRLPLRSPRPRHPAHRSVLPPLIPRLTGAPLGDSETFWSMITVEHVWEIVSDHLPVLRYKRRQSGKRQIRPSELLLRALVIESAPRRAGKDLRSGLCESSRRMIPRQNTGGILKLKGSYAMNFLNRISVDPNVCFGKPCIRRAYLGLLAAGLTGLGNDH